MAAAFVAPVAESRRRRPSESRTRVVACTVPDAALAVRISPKVPMSVRGLPDMTSPLGATLRLGHALDPCLDLRDAVPQFASDVDSARTAPVTAQVIDRLGSDAEVVGELSGGEHLL